ncbi:hypothetical protein MG296_03665 [Flavobacteriaceae bacterium TK19130]|nr:hypothetical protein [Thermobacterium salinum]
MKRIFYPLLGIVLAAFLLAASSRPVQQKPTLQGVWEMVNQYTYDNGMNIDSTNTIHGTRQVKMYSESKVMWSRYNPNDSVEWFGYGTYTVKDGFLEERLEYASYRMMKIADTTQVFRYELELNENTFRQIAYDNDGEKYYSENYRRIE